MFETGNKMNGGNMSTTTRAKGKAIAKPQAATNNPAKTKTVTYTLGYFEEDGFKTYIAKVKGQKFLVGQFDTTEEARTAVKTHLPEWLNREEAKKLAKTAAAE